MTLKFGPDLTYFLWSLAAGIILAVIYDIIRVIRKMIKIPDLIVNLTDIVFLIFSGAVAIITAYIFNNGELRIYSLFCIAGFFMIYKIVIGDLIVKFTVKILKLIEKTVIKFILIILLPFKKIYSVIQKLLKYCGNATLGIFKGISRIIPIKKKS